MYSVTSAAVNTALTTLDTVKSELNITAADSDDFLTRQISVVTNKIGSYLGISQADDSSMTFGRRSISATYRPGFYRPDRIVLPTWPMPVVTIDSVTEAGVTLDSASYECDKAAGFLFKLFGNYRTKWNSSVIGVGLTLGWLLPDDEGRNLPYDIEQAAIELIKVANFARERDPTLKTESMMQREYIYEVFAPSELVDGMPAHIAALLAPYKNLAVG